LICRKSNINYSQKIALKSLKMKGSYLKLLETGELKKRVEKAKDLLKECKVCPRECNVDRLSDKKGFCKTGKNVYVASFFPHHGEEFPIRGFNGSGTIFFSYCNLGCVYCQNYDISHLGEGKEITPEHLASIMLYLQEEGCHNINWVTPSHIVPQLLEALYIASQKGLKIPIVYNTSSYDSLESLKLLDGVVDIYLADLKYLNEEYGRKYSKVKNYPEIAKKAIKEMHRQVGDLKTDERGIAYKGLLVRHLVLPNDISTTQEVLDFLKSISPNIHVNIMSQYHPYYQAFNYPELSRKITTREYFKALDYAEKLGIKIVKD
jgi:putative pyruvate formate lyase activating enzyme